MTDFLQRVAVGDKFKPSAEFHNATVETILRVNRMGSTGGGPTTDTLLPGQVRIRNSSGEDRERYDVLAITGVAITGEENEADFLNQPIFTGTKPGVGYQHFGKFVVLAEPAKDGAIVRAWATGVFPAWVKGNGPYADIYPDEAGYLRAAPFGHAKILWSASGEEERWAAVRMVQPQLQTAAKALADIPSHTSGNVEVLLLASPTGIIIEAANEGPDVVNESRVEIVWVNERWEIGDGDCETED